MVTPSLSELTLEGYNFVQNLICIINRKDGTLIHVKEDYILRLKLVANNEESKFDYQLTCPIGEVFGFEVLK